MNELSYAIIGKGKTGNHVVELLKLNKCEVFDSTHKPTVERLKKHDVAIIFLPGSAFTDLIPTLVEAKTPVVSGATGWEGREKLDSELKAKKLTWVWGSNFALGMNLVKLALEQLKLASKLTDAKYAIHEVHHIMKVDAPSGTALSWKEWLGGMEDIPVTSERTGDVIGFHQMTLNLPYEKIVLSHEALDRKIFASGAIWAANKLVDNKDLYNGLITFDQLVKKELL
ncbi:MAG: 4-hydroxy-tetrahydrodipicolinate reductase [Bdellovibrio sp.]